MEADACGADGDGYDDARGVAAQLRKSHAPGARGVSRRHHLPGGFHPQLRDQNRRDIGKSQSIWTGSKMETPGSPRA
eukprot:COSAG01_NODE_6739_length_3521_cov_30.112800_3_plen_77_part_00